MSNKLIKFPKKEKEYNGSVDMYSLNKEIMKTYPTIHQAKLDELLPKLEDWFNWILDAYAMLLCHERRDYTIFHLYEKENRNPPAVAAKELITCLQNRGDIISIDLDSSQNAWEIWLRINKEPYCYYLFRCDEFVIEC